MAPQFRSSGVGYLRLADDMGKYGKCFLSVDGGATFLDDRAFAGEAEEQWSPIDAGRRGAPAQHRFSDGSKPPRRRGSRDLPNDPSAACRRVASLVSRLKGNLRELKWKDKAEQLREVAASLDTAIASLTGSPTTPLPRIGTPEFLAAVDASTGQQEAWAALALVQDVLGERGRNVHVTSASLGVLRAAGQLAGDAVKEASAWRVVFPQLLGMLRDTSRPVATAAHGTMEALHLRSFRLGDPHALPFIVTELQALTGAGGKGARTLSATATLSWLVSALERERHMWQAYFHRTNGSTGPWAAPGPNLSAVEQAAQPLTRLVGHRELEARDLATQALAALLLAGEAQSSGGANTTDATAAKVNRENPKNFARLSVLLQQGRQRGDHLAEPSAKDAAEAAAAMIPKEAATAAPPKKARGAPGASTQPQPSPGTSAVALQWAQVEWLLRRPISSPVDLERVQDEAARGERYLQNVRKTAKRLNMRRGALSRAALPFDDHTSLADQSNLDNRRDIHSSEAQALLANGRISSSELAALTADATTLRALLRVKIADDADLDQAEAAVKELFEFLRVLRQEANRQGRGMFECFKEGI